MFCNVKWFSMAAVYCAETGAMIGEDAEKTQDGQEEKWEGTLMQ